MEKQNNKIANYIVIFFKSFRISLLIGILTFPLMYFVVFKAYKCFDPDVSNARINCERDGKPYFGNCIWYGDNFQLKVRRHYYHHAPTSTYELQSEIRKCCKLWLRDRLIHSLLITGGVLVGLPFLIVIIRLIGQTIKGTRKWVDENRTI